MISLLAGKPNPDTFPITSVSVNVRSPIIGEKESTVQISGPVLEEGLQYTATAGIPSLVKWFTGLQEYSHGRKEGEGWRISMGSGSQDALYKVAS